MTGQIVWDDVHKILIMHYSTVIPTKTNQVGLSPLFLRFSIENAEIAPLFVHFNDKLRENSHRATASLSSTGRQTSATHGPGASTDDAVIDDAVIDYLTE